MAAILSPPHHDTHVGTPLDQSLSRDSDKHLCAGFLAQSDVGYAQESHPEDPRLVRSVRGRDGLMARSLVPLLSHPANGKRLCDCPVVLPTAARREQQHHFQQHCPADLDESSMEHAMDDTTSRNRKRTPEEASLESHSNRRPRRAGQPPISTLESKPIPALGRVGLGTQASLSHPGIYRRRSERRQPRGLAQFGGTFGPNSSLVDSQQSNRSGSSASNLCQVVPSLAGHFECRRTDNLQSERRIMEDMVVGSQGGGTLPKRLCPVSILYVEGVSGSQSRYYDKFAANNDSPRRIIKVEHILQRVQHAQPPVVLLAQQKIKRTRDSQTKKAKKTNITKDDTPDEPEQKKSNTKNSRRKNSDDSNSGDNEESSTGATFLKRIENAWTWFFYARTTNLNTVTLIRTAYAVVVLINLSLLWMDLDWFLHVMPTPLARKTMDPDTGCLLQYLPEGGTIWGPKLCVIVWMMHAALLALNIKPQWQAFGIFACQYQLNHHNSLLWNGEDFVMRLLAFLFIFWPNNAPSFWELLSRKKGNAGNSWPMVGLLWIGGLSIWCMVWIVSCFVSKLTIKILVCKLLQWPFRLVQIQMCLIYFSAGGLKWGGEQWADGSALYQVVHNDALYGGWFNPAWMFGYTRPLAFLTHATIWHELGVLPLLWFERTRKIALMAVVGFHFMLDASMNLNTFHYLMIVGWCTFLIQPSLPPVAV